MREGLGIVFGLRGGVGFGVRFSNYSLGRCRRALAWLFPMLLYLRGSCWLSLRICLDLLGLPPLVLGPDTIHDTIRDSFSFISLYNGTGSIVWGLAPRARGCLHGN